MKTLEIFSWLQHNSNNLYENWFVFFFVWVNMQYPFCTCVYTWLCVETFSIERKKQKICSYFDKTWCIVFKTFKDFPQYDISIANWICVCVLWTSEDSLLSNCGASLIVYHQFFFSSSCFHSIPFHFIHLFAHPPTYSLHLRLIQFIIWFNINNGTQKSYYSFVIWNVNVSVSVCVCACVFVLAG